MANTADRLFETETQLESMVEASGKTIPKPGGRANIVEHLDYIIALMGTMVTDETYKEAKKRMAKGYNAIPDRVETINWLLSTGEISGDVDIEPITITENGEYMPGAGKVFGRVVVSTPVIELRSINITENGEYIPDSGQAYDNVTVNIPEPSVDKFMVQMNLNTSDFEMITGSYGNLANSITKMVVDDYTTLLSSDMPFSMFNELSYIEMKSIAEIPSEKFNQCSKLEYASFPVCTTIESKAFMNCSTLTDIYFPNCTTIGARAFYNCNSLKFRKEDAGIYTFSKVTTIGESAFYGCSSIDKIGYFYCGLTKVESIPQFAFCACTNMTTAEFDNCSTIYDNAFTNCINLSWLHCPNCMEIHGSPFVNCKKLSAINIGVFESSRVCQLESDASIVFANTPIVNPEPGEEYGIVKVNKNAVSLYKNNSMWSSISDRIVGY